MSQPARLYSREGQLERTALAWSRTILVLAVNGALLVRSAPACGAWAEVAGLCVLSVTLAAWVVTNRAYRRQSAGPTAALLTRGMFTVVAVVVFVGVGILDLLAVITHS
ncbi:DUF202 domain-containing protein [Actinopolymorpha singaporensis]|uniref:DUF202 domain-containing protein n=1 Tax=Actinopolymorpha singaporensis TaxID=117157 RepID=A0A1H1LZZ6_9ACTN|nr:DUF202 domain-containing protein [Actinopolymorpha singaporensis]SDR79369.1 protein of unknown function [Actinopolymorpha singaporensis]